MSPSSALPFLPLLLLASTFAGLLTLALGLRGRPSLSSPRCAKCSYDLRTLPFLSDSSLRCPECGSPLAHPHAVSFGTYRRQPRTILLGLSLLTLPWLLLLPLFLFRTTLTRAGAAAYSPGYPFNLPSQPTPALLSLLPAHIADPSTWNELERRLQSNTLPVADSRAAINTLITSLNADRAAGRPQSPLTWSENFVQAAIARGDLTPAQLTSLCQAFYGPSAPDLTLRPRARQNDPLPLSLNIYKPWNLPHTQFCWCLTRVTADNDPTPLTPHDRYNPKLPLAPDQLSGTNHTGDLQLSLPNTLPPGPHTLTLNFQFGALPENNTLRGTDGKPGTPDKWPSPLARWTATVTKPVTILPPGSPLVSTTTRPTSNPFLQTTLSVTSAVARPSSRGGADILLKFALTSDPSPPISYKITLHAGPQSIPYGTLTAARLSPNSTLRSYPDHHTTKKPLPPNLTHIDIELTPDPASAEHFLELNEIWGQPLTLKNIPLQRYDLPPTTAPSP